jgi:hypothetical protein
VIRKESVTDGPPVYVIEWYVKNKSYIGEVSEDTRYEIKIGDCCMVKYYTGNPNICEIDTKNPVKCD